MSTLSDAAQELARKQWDDRSPAERRTYTAASRAAALVALKAKWEDQVDPDRRLPADERERLAAEARRRHLAAAGRASGRARRARSAQARDDAAA